jgi:hypothetical protein
MIFITGSHGPVGVMRTIEYNLHDEERERKWMEVTIPMPITLTDGGRWFTYRFLSRSAIEETAPESSTSIPRNRGSSHARAACHQPPKTGTSPYLFASQSCWR